MKIGTTTAAQKAVLGSQSAHKGLTESLERISSGKKINSASDDAAGLAIANVLKSNALAMGQGIRNANDGIAITQIADSALTDMTGILQTMRTQILSAANGSQSQESRVAIQNDLAGSLESLDSIAQSTSYNGQSLLTGDFSNKNFALGPDTMVGLSIPAVDTGSLAAGETGALADINVTTPEGAQAALETVDKALEQIASARSGVGSTQNQFSSSIENLTQSRISMESAQSQIMDVDLAEESMILNQMKTLEKASTFALSQTNAFQKERMARLFG